MSTPFDQIQADPEALRALGRAVLRKMICAAVVAFVFGVAAGWLLFA